MLEKLNLPSPLEPVNYKLFQEKKINVSIKRDDLIHSQISGNKWRKLKLNIEKFKFGKYDRILTFGGAYSNHISALAAVGKELGISTIGIIRGDELNENSNETLKNAANSRMELIFVNRQEYTLRYEKDYKHQLRNRFGNTLIIEEGGANYYGVLGCTEIVAEIGEEPDYYILPSGTGTTAAGILFGVEKSKVISVPVFKNGDFIANEIKELLYYTGLLDEELDAKMKLLHLETNFHFGGYGKYNGSLINFINQVYEETKIPLDQIYTGKMFYSLCEMIKSGKIPEESNVVVVHTGGLQGLHSIKEKLIFDPINP